MRAWAALASQLLELGKGHLPHAALTVFLLPL